MRGLKGCATHSSCACRSTPRRRRHSRSGTAFAGSGTCRMGRTGGRQRLALPPNAAASEQQQAPSVSPAPAAKGPHQPSALVATQGLAVELVSFGATDKEAAKARLTDSRAKMGSIGFAQLLALMRKEKTRHATFDGQINDVFETCGCPIGSDHAQNRHRRWQPCPTVEKCRLARISESGRPSASWLPACAMGPASHPCARRFGATHDPPGLAPVA